MKRNSLNLFLFSLITIILVSSLILAENENGTNESAGNMTNMNQTCANLVNKIEIKVTQFELGRGVYLNRFSTLETRLNITIDRLAANGVNVSSLRENQVQLNEKIGKFNDDFLLFVDDLNATKNFTCGQSQGQFKDALKTARDQLKVVRDDAEAIRDYYQKSIKPLLFNSMKEIRQDRMGNISDIKERINNVREEMKQDRKNITLDMEKIRELRNRMGNGSRNMSINKTEENNSQNE